MDGFDKNMKRYLLDSAQNFQTIKKKCSNRYSRDQIMSSLSKLISKRKKTTFMWSHQVSGKKRRKHQKRSPMLLSHDGSPIPNSSQIHQISDKSSLHHHDELSLLFSLSQRMERNTSANVWWHQRPLKKYDFLFLVLPKVKVWRLEVEGETYLKWYSKLVKSKLT